MRCPNCGNENPDDYVFCDECGARLQNVAAGEASTASTPLGAQGGVASSPWQTSGPVSDLSSQGDGSSTVGSTDGAATAPADTSGTEAAAGAQPDAASTSGTTDDASMSSGGLGASTGDGASASDTSAEYGLPAGSASQGEPAYEMAPMGGDQEDAGVAQDAGSTGTAGAADTLQPAGGQAAMEETPDAMSMPMGMGAGGGEESTAGAATDADAGEGDDESAAMPVTEDTMAGDTSAEPAEATMQGGAEEEEPTLPGVIPVMGSYSDTDVVGAQDTAASSEGAVGGAGEQQVAGGSEWASVALNYLDQAQQAARSGDWSAFGEALGNLRSYLQTASQGSPAGASGLGAVPAMQPSTSGASASAGAMTGGAIGGTAGQSYMPDMSSTGTSGPMGGTTIEAAPSSGSIGMGMEGGPGAGAATLEPEAEAGTLGAEAAEAAPGAETMMARLVMIATGAELPLPEQEEIMVGREDPSSGIFPDIDLTPYGGEDGGVSRRHARLLHIGDDYFVEDLQSTNYTKLDGQRLPAHVRERLEDGARVDFGRVATIFRRS